MAHASLTIHDRKGDPNFKLTLERECERARRYQEAFALIALTLDSDSSGRKLKTTGSNLGENNLRLLTKYIVWEIRKTDLIGQIGGTICVLLLHVGPEETLRIGERIRTRTELSKFPGSLPHQSVSHTVSIGAACFPHQSVLSSNLVERAMERLRLARFKGGNRVILDNDQ